MADEPVTTVSAPQTAQTVVPEVAPAAPAPQTPAPAGNLPTDSRERTREQFEKLLESNRRLYDKVGSLEQQLVQQETNRMNNPAQVPQRQSVPPQVNPNDFVERDPITGEKLINEDRLRARIEEINQRAVKAEQAVQQYAKTTEEREIERQNTETFSSYPDLNPGSEKFDPAFNDLVTGVLYSSLAKAKPMTFKEAADFVAAQTKRGQTATPAPVDDTKAKEAAQAAQTLKEQSSAQATSQPRAQQQMSDEQELETLRYRTRYLNDDAALAERIKHTEHILPKDAEQV